MSGFLEAVEAGASRFEGAFLSGSSRQQEACSAHTLSLDDLFSFNSCTLLLCVCVLLSCPPDQLQPQGVPDPRRTQLHPTSRTARDPTATAPVRIRAARDPIEAARVPASSRPDRV
ncbi:hypothetical protein DY000_02061034 [Brassica cretica]|uniref:Uncharacterized protein n=1 Tax=Brassica cretica TaxID=69181 RepID=A0ABQ7AP41_BRACR|nr:hypothetical protein DY000_02061034 [Brassica cretica]